VVILPGIPFMFVWFVPAEGLAPAPLEPAVEGSAALALPAAPAAAEAEAVEPGEGPVERQPGAMTEAGAEEVEPAEEAQPTEEAGPRPAGPEAAAEAGAGSPR
jgi:hypothetical protein